MTTIVTLRTRLAEEYTRDPQFSVWSQNVVDNALNKGYTQIQNDLGWSAMESDVLYSFSTVIGTELYSLPTNFVRLKLITLDGKPLTKTTREITRRDNDSIEQGEPNLYYLYNNQVGLYNVPDSIKTVNMEYSSVLTTISDAQDSDLPNTSDDAMLLFAAYKLFLGVNDVGRASMYKQDYENEMNKLRQQLLFDDYDMVFGYSR